MWQYSQGKRQSLLKQTSALRKRHLQDLIGTAIEPPSTALPKVIISPSAIFKGRHKGAKYPIRTGIETLITRVLPVSISDSLWGTHSQISKRIGLFGIGVKTRVYRCTWWMGRWISLSMSQQWALWLISWWIDWRTHSFDSNFISQRTMHNINMILGLPSRRFVWKGYAMSSDWSIVAAAMNPASEWVLFSSKEYICSTLSIPIFNISQKWPQRYMMWSWKNSQHCIVPSSSKHQCKICSEG